LRRFNTNRLDELIGSADDIRQRMIDRVANTPNSSNRLIAKMILEAFAIETHAHLVGMYHNSPWDAKVISFCQSGERERFGIHYIQVADRIETIPLDTLCSTPQLVELHLGIVYGNAPIGCDEYVEPLVEDIDVFVV